MILLLLLGIALAPLAIELFILPYVPLGYQDESGFHYSLGDAGCCTSHGRTVGGNGDRSSGGAFQSTNVAVRPPMNEVAA